MDKIYDYILQKESHIGLLRPSQEDAVLTLVHPEDDRYKILAVCDGMGGKQYGDIAANYVIQKFGYWFLKHPSVEFSDIIHFNIPRIAVTDFFGDISSVSDKVIPSVLSALTAARTRA